MQITHKKCEIANCELTIHALKRLKHTPIFQFIYFLLFFCKQNETLSGKG